MVRQLVLNSEHTGSARQEVRIWCGALLQRIHVIWPRFPIHLLDRLSWTGGPLLGRHREPSAKQFLDALQVHQWQARQCGFFSARPLLTQQNHIPYHIILRLGSATTGQRSWTSSSCAARYITDPDFCTVSWRQYRCVQSNVANPRGHGRFRAYKCKFFQEGCVPDATIQRL